MQFFPPVQPGPVQTVQFGGMTESLETKAGQDFENLLSAHMEQADASSDSPSAGPAEARSTAVPAASAPTAKTERDEAKQEDVRANEHSSAPEKQQTEQIQANNQSSKVREKPQQKQIQADEANSSQSAKPTTGEKEPVQVDEEILTSGVLEEVAIDDDGAIADEAEKVLSELAGEAEGLLSGLAGKAEGMASRLGMLLSSATEVKSEGQVQPLGKMGGLASRVQAMQDLLRLFRQSDLATRAELAVSMSTQLRTLRDDMATFDRTINLETLSSKQAPSLSSGKISRILKLIENVAHRIETSGSSPQALLGASSTASNVESRNVQPKGGMSVSEAPVQTKTSRHGVAQERVSETATLTETSFSSPERTEDVVSQNVRAPQDRFPASRLSPSQTTPSRAVNVQSAPLASENMLRVQTVSSEENGTYVGKQSAPALPTHEAPSVGIRSVREIQTKSESVAGVETVQVVNSKSAAKGLSVPGGKWDSRLENTAETQFAETKTSGGRKELQLEYSATPDQEKTAASEARVKIATEVESTTRTTGLGLQTPAPTRLAAPVSVKTPEVIRQAQNRTFKDQNQDINQRFTSLDSAATKTTGGHQEPRPELSVTPPREKTAASKISTSGARAKIATKDEATTQATTSTLQTPTQSRLEAPVNARTREVTKPVENGALKNQSQNLDQLAIQLDPAETKITGGRKEVRSEFFATSDREKAATFKTSTSGARENSATEVEVTTQTMTSTLQTPTQSRLEAPVNASTREVTKPVENRARKNQSQDLDQLALQLDPAETKTSGGRQEPRPELSATPDREKTATSKISTSGARPKIATAVEVTPLATTSTLQASTQNRLEAPVNSKTSEVYKQVENGAFKNLGQGLKQLVLRLDPVDLGHVSVILQVRGKEVQAVIRASSQETAQVLNEQLGQLRTQLESQGLKVSRLEVQTQLSDFQSQSEWQGAEQHNRFQENRELALSALRLRTLGQADSSLARDMQNIPQREKSSPSGLDIFA